MKQVRAQVAQVANGRQGTKSHTSRMKERSSRMKERCKHDGACYRQNPDHWSRVRHCKQDGPVPRPTQDTQAEAEPMGWNWWFIRGHCDAEVVQQYLEELWQKGEESRNRVWQRRRKLKIPQPKGKVVLVRIDFN